VTNRTRLPNGVADPAPGPAVLHGGLDGLGRRLLAKLCGQFADLGVG